MLFNTTRNFYSFKALLILGANPYILSKKGESIFSYSPQVFKDELTARGMKNELIR
jgi:hypothetical protein